MGRGAHPVTSVNIFAQIGLLGLSDAASRCPLHKACIQRTTYSVFLLLCCEDALGTFAHLLQRDAQKCLGTTRRYYTHMYVYSQEIGTMRDAIMKCPRCFSHLSPGHTLHTPHLLIVLCYEYTLGTFAHHMKRYAQYCSGSARRYYIHMYVYSNEIGNMRDAIMKCPRCFFHLGPGHALHAPHVLILCFVSTLWAYLHIT